MKFSQPGRHIYFLCPESTFPFGGIKKIYEFVDDLNTLGASAFVLHQNDFFRITWFENTTPVVYLNVKDMSIRGRTLEGDPIILPPMSKQDILVIPEISVNHVMNLKPNLEPYIVINNQNTFLTFPSMEMPLYRCRVTPEMKDVSHYSSEKVLGALVISEYSAKYMEYVFPNLDVHRIHIAVNIDITFPEEKSKTIAFMPRKRPEEFQNLLRIFRERNSLLNWELLPIANMTHKNVISALKESAIFLSLSYQEGFGLPPAEAMVCGCTVIGYHGLGGSEFLMEPYAYPIAECDTVAFAKKVEEIALDYEQRPEYYKKQARDAANFIQKTYSSEQQREDLKKAWTKILSKHDECLKLV